MPTLNTEEDEIMSPYTRNNLPLDLIIDLSQAMSSTDIKLNKVKKEDTTTLMKLKKPAALTSRMR